MLDLRGQNLQMNKLVKVLLYFIVGVLVILGISYLVFRNIPKASTKNVQAEMSISAQQIFDDFSENENLANKEYIGKVITVDGNLVDSFTDEQGNPAIILGNEESDLVFVTLYPSEADKINQLQMEDKIKVKGSCTGMLTEVTINKAIVVD